MAHDQTSSTGIDRRDGFLNKIANEYPNIKVVSVQYAAGVQLQPTEIAKAMLTANPDLGDMFGTNEGSAIGIVNAVREIAAESVTIIGYDTGRAQTDAICKDRRPARSLRTLSELGNRPRKRRRLR